MFGQAMINVPKDFQDYDDTDSNIEKRLSRWKYWQNLKLLKNEFKEETGSTDHREYKIWLENKYGFIPIETSDGMMTDDLDIIDQKKYTFFVLKYG